MVLCSSFFALSSCTIEARVIISAGENPASVARRLRSSVQNFLYCSWKSATRESGEISQRTLYSLGIKRVRMVMVSTPREVQNWRSCSRSLRLSGFILSSPVSVFISSSCVRIPRVICRVTRLSSPLVRVAKRV